MGRLKGTWAGTQGPFGIRILIFRRTGYQTMASARLPSLLAQVGDRADPAECYGFAAWFLVSAPLQFLGGYLDMTVDRSEPEPALLARA